MIYEQVQVIVHGDGGHSILQVFGEETFVDHVVVQSIIQLNVDIAHQSVPHLLLNKKRKPLANRMTFYIYHRKKKEEEVVTGSRRSQASLLGAKKVYDPGPSISSRNLDRAEYSWVVVALTKPRVS